MEQAEHEMQHWEAKERRGAYITSSSSSSSGSDGEDSSSGARAGPDQMIQVEARAPARPLARSPLKELRAQRSRELHSRGGGHVSEHVFVEASSLAGFAHWEQVGPYTYSAARELQRCSASCRRHLYHCVCQSASFANVGNHQCCTPCARIAVSGVYECGRG